jgi:hypothetical protein
LDFDPESQQFVSKSIAHNFRPETGRNVVLQKLADWHKHRELTRKRDALTKQIAAMTPELRDDIGMTVVFAASHHP